MSSNQIESFCNRDRLRLMIFAFAHEVVVSNVPSYSNVKAVFLKGLDHVVDKHKLSKISHVRSMNNREDPYKPREETTKIYFSLNDCLDNNHCIYLLKGERMITPEGKCLVIKAEPTPDCQIKIPWRPDITYY